MLDYEYYLINLDYDNNYNTSHETTGGDLISRHPNKDEIIEKIRETIKHKWESLSEEEYKIICDKFTGINNPNYKHGMYSQECIINNKLERENFIEDNGLRENSNIKLLNKPAWNSNTSNNKEYIAYKNKSKEIIEDLNDKPIYILGKIFKDINYANYIYKTDLSRRILSDKPQNSEYRVASADDLNKYDYFNIKTDEIKYFNLNDMADNNSIYILCDNILFHSYQEASIAYGVSDTSIYNRVKDNKIGFRVATIEDLSKYDFYNKEKHGKLKLKDQKKVKKVYWEGKIYNSAKELSNTLNIPLTTISFKCKNNKEKYKEYYYIEN